ncbi:hypothetical protein [Roseinatronobacter thiooxidans]|uniref:hypothetical protein n=1 Tax=Roseinatronobacter thiooxidans TaxID=121821 RepID=UPI0011B4637D|nr:hypothetical protein [Roseinatronobacter thiooxidans]
MHLFFSNQVLDHAPSSSDPVQTARRLLPRGLFVAIKPNVSLCDRDAAPEGWYRFWGKVHPNMLNDTFWAREFADRPHFIGSLPNGSDQIVKWAKAPSKICDRLRGDLLICAAMI